MFPRICSNYYLQAGGGVICRVFFCGSQSSKKKGYDARCKRNISWVFCSQRRLNNAPQAKSIYNLRQKTNISTKNTNSMRLYYYIICFKYSASHKPSEKACLYFVYFYM